MHAENNGPARPRRIIWRILGWGGAVALILTPLVAMQFTTEVNWEETDFIVAAIIFGIMGGLIEFAVRLSSNWYFRFGPQMAGDLYTSGQSVIEVARAHGMTYAQVRKLLTVNGTTIRSSSDRLKGRTRKSSEG